ncbi:MAG: serine hydrolase [Candidatus Falkowbacteria bacterium]
MIESIIATIVTSFFLLNISFNDVFAFVQNPINPGAVIEKQATIHLPQKKSGIQDIQVSAYSAAVFDVKDKLFIFEKNSNDRLRIASITKLMTALVFLDTNPNWDQIYEIKREDRRDGGKVYLYLGDKVTVKNLFYAMLVGSDNSAAIALVHSAGLSEEDFVVKMNEKAQSLGLLQTRFIDPVGLSNSNVSTAREVALLAQATLTRSEISQAVSTEKTEFTTVAGVSKTIESTDALLNNFPDGNIKILGGKTGYTDLAGYCFVAKFVDSQQHEIISVVLNTPSENDRFKQTAKLVRWVYDSFEW